MKVCGDCEHYRHDRVAFSGRKCCMVDVPIWVDEFDRYSVHEDDKRAGICPLFKAKIKTEVKNDH